MELTAKMRRVYNRRMNPSTGKSGKIADDVALVSRIKENDDKAWEAFVEKFTDWSLYKAREWCRAHCPYSAGQCFCGLTSLSMQRHGRAPRRDLPDCDEGLDTYVWILGQLKKKVTRYTGKNECLLSTFVWTILNSRELHIDWLRWKYGRIF